MLSRVRENILLYLKYSLFQTILFTSVYGLTNYLSEHHLYSFKFYFPFELSIPLLPGMIIVYLSLNILMLMPVLFLDKLGLRNLNRLMTITTLIAGLIFLIFPAPCGFQRVEVEGVFSPFFKILYSLDKTGNTLPSLHITFSYIIVRLISAKNILLKKYFWTWFVMISLSVIFTHQHHILDIIAGIILAEFSYRKYKVEI